MMLEVGMAVFTNTSAKSIETRQCLGAPFLLQLSAPKHRSVWLSYLNFSIHGNFCMS